MCAVRDAHSTPFSHIVFLMQGPSPASGIAVHCGCALYADTSHPFGPRLLMSAPHIPACLVTTGSWKLLICAICLAINYTSPAPPQCLHRCRGANPSVYNDVGPMSTRRREVGSMVGTGNHFKVYNFIKLNCYYCE